jgi:hypothetical protein
MTDESSDADHEPAPGDGDWDSGEGVRGPPRAGIVAAAAIAVAVLVVVALLGVYTAAFNEMIGAHRLDFGN